MSAADTAALFSRSRSRSSSKALLHIQPEEELAKHDGIGGRASKSILLIPSSSNLDIPTVTTRSHTADHHHHHHHHHHHPNADISRDTFALDASMGTRSKSRSKAAPVNSSMHEPTVSLSTHRVLSYGPSGDDLVHRNSADSIHSLDGGGALSTDSQSSSKTIPQQQYAAGEHQDANLKPNSPRLLENATSFLTRDVFLHISLSLLVLGSVVLMASHVGVPASHHLIRTFKGMNLLPKWRLPLATSHQVQELKEDLMFTLKLSTERLKERVEELKSEMQKEMKSRKEEAEEMNKEFGVIKEEHQRSKDTDTHHIQSGNALGDMSLMSVVGARPDYALASGGGRVVGHSLAFTPASSAPSWIDKIPTFLIRSTRIHPLAHIILQPSFNQPGQCLPLATSNVYVEVALRTPIYADQVTLSHVSKSIAYDVSSAPKEFQVYGLPPPLSTSKPASWVLVGEFEYDVDSPMAAQAFALSETAKNTLISTIKLQILSNYGSPSHTCIYRLQVHGKEPT
ncbi:hypothetical protein L7F22_066645 [Adiantum nelumboides]|nr:hypothetical protein [Adiantum nelumboides]